MFVFCIRKFYLHPTVNSNNSCEKSSRYFETYAIALSTINFACVMFFTLILNHNNNNNTRSSGSADTNRLFFIEAIFYQRNKNNKLLIIIGSIITLLYTIEIHMRLHPFSFFINNNMFVTSILSTLRGSGRGLCSFTRDNSFYELTSSFRSSVHDIIRSINKSSCSTFSNLLHLLCQCCLK